MIQDGCGSDLDHRPFSVHVLLTAFDNMYPPLHFGSITDPYTCEWRTTCPFRTKYPFCKCGIAHSTTVHDGCGSQYVDALHVVAETDALYPWWQVNVIISPVVYAVLPPSLCMFPFDTEGNEQRNATNIK